VTALFMLSSNIPREVREARGYHPIGGSGGNSNAWHLSTDTLDKADPDVLVRDVRVYATVLARLLRPEVVPLDFRDAVERHREVLDDYQATAGDEFDLSPVREELEAVGDALDGFYDAVDAGEIPPREANEALKAVERRLVRVSYVSEGRFEQDPALGRPPYPRLAPATELPELSGDDYRFTEVHLERARNDVRAELRAALDALP
jgi:hypothetical protein